MPSVSSGITLRLVLDGTADVLVPGTLGYDSASPFAVTAVFHTREGDVVWVFARDLLEDGLRAPAGQGDVALWPSGHGSNSVVCLALTSPSGSALLQTLRSDVRAFLDATLAVVPWGAEMDSQDLDAELAHLLDDDTSSRH